MTGGAAPSDTGEDHQTLEYCIHRPVYNYADFNATHGEVLRKHRPLADMAREAVKRKCNANSVVSSLRHLVPPTVDLIRSRQYSKTDLVSDIIAGFTMCVFHIPQGLAYGMLAGLKPVNGLYTSLIPVFIFAIFGRSRHLSIGTFAVMALLLLDMVEDNYEAYLPTLENSNVSIPMNMTEIEYAKLQTALVGSFAAAVIVLIIGVLRLGFFMRYMSDAMLKGFTTAAGVHVLMSQVPLVLGVKVSRYPTRFKIIGHLISVFSVISATNFVTLGISAFCCVVLYVVKEYVTPQLKKKTKIPLPIELIIIILALVVSEFGKLNERFGVAVVGEVPRGLPAPLVPDFSFVPKVLPSALPVGIVGSTITMSLAKMYCLQFQYNYDVNEDFVILGVSSIVSSFFQCFFACGALARNSVVVSVGMKSQVASLVSCICMVLVLVALGPLLYSVPTCVLGSIIAISLLNVLRQVYELPVIWKISRIDFFIWLVSALSVLLIDVTIGLAIGFGFTLFSVTLRTQSPRIAILGHIGDTGIYKNILVYPAAKEPPGVKIIRFDAALNFANAERFRDFTLSLASELKSGDAAVSSQSGEAATAVHTIIFDCSSWVYADMVGVRIAKETYSALKRKGFRILFASCKESVRVHFFMEDFFKEADMSLFFLTVHDAVIFGTKVAPTTPVAALKPSANREAPAVNNATKESDGVGIEMRPTDRFIDETEDDEAKREATRSLLDKEDVK